MNLSVMTFDQVYEGFIVEIWGLVSILNPKYDSRVHMICLLKSWLCLTNELVYGILSN